MDLRDAKHLSPGRSPTRHPDRGLATSGDFDVGPSDTAPPSSHRLHYRLFACEPGSKTPRRVSETERVLLLVRGEAAVYEPRVLLEDPLDTGNICQINSESDNPHGYSTVTVLAKLRGLSTSKPLALAT